MIIIAIKYNNVIALAQQPIDDSFQEIIIYIYVL